MCMCCVFNEQLVTGGKVWRAEQLPAHQLSHVNYLMYKSSLLIFKTTAMKKA